MHAGHGSMEAASSQQRHHSPRYGLGSSSSIMQNAEQSSEQTPIRQWMGMDGRWEEVWLAVAMALPLVLAVG